MIARFNHGVANGVVGSIYGLFGASIKKTLPDHILGMDTHNPKTANMIAALALGKFIFGLLDYHRNGSAIREGLGASATYTWVDLLMATTSPLISMFTSGTDEDRRKVRRELIQNGEEKLLLHMIVSLGENVTSSFIGHGALALMGYSTFSFQQAVVDAAVATAPSLIPTRWV